MEDIKEQDTESERQRESQQKPAAAATMPPSDGVPIGRKISEAQSKKYKLSTELKRLKTSK